MASVIHVYNYWRVLSSTSGGSLSHFLLTHCMLGNIGSHFGKKSSAAKSIQNVANILSLFWRHNDLATNTLALRSGPTMGLIWEPNCLPSGTPKSVSRIKWVKLNCGLVNTFPSEHQTVSLLQIPSLFSLDKTLRSFSAYMSKWQFDIVDYCLHYMFIVVYFET